MAEMVLTQNFKTWATHMLLGSNLKISSSAGGESTSGNNDGSSSNYYRAFGTTPENNKPIFVTSFLNTSGNQTKVAPYTNTPSPISAASSLNYINAENNQYAIHSTYFEIGSNNTPASENDFKLNSPYTSSDVTIINYPHLLEKRNGKACMICNIQVKALSQLNINEIGMLKCFSPSSGAAFVAVLMGRCVLDEPVTLAAGESKTFELVVSLF